MTNLTLQAQWHENINQIETSDAITGGTNGNANIAPKQLAENILFLKQSIEGISVPADNSSTVSDLQNSITALQNDVENIKSQLQPISLAVQTIDLAHLSFSVNKNQQSSIAYRVYYCSGCTYEVLSGGDLVLQIPAWFDNSKHKLYICELKDEPSTAETIEDNQTSLTLQSAGASNDEFSYSKKVIIRAI